LPPNRTLRQSSLRALCGQKLNRLPFLRRIPKLLVRLLHLRLESLARLLPGIFTQRNATFALALAVVIARVVPAASKATALVLGMASMGVGRGARPLARAIILAALALALASIHPPANMRLLQPQ